MVASADLSQSFEMVSGRGGPENFAGVIPTTGGTMDLNADGVYAAPDYSAIFEMVSGRAANVGGIPGQLDLTYAPAVGIQEGMTTHLSVKVRARRADLGIKYMTGAAVVFTVDTASSSGTATLFGGDGPPMGHVDYGDYRWDQTGQLGFQADDVDPAKVMIRIDTAGTIVIKVHTPQIGTSGDGRYMPYLEISPVEITGTE